MFKMRHEASHLVEALGMERGRMNSIIANALDLASSILRFIGSSDAIAEVKNLETAQLALASELQKGYESDDAKVEALQAEIAIRIQAANRLLQIQIAKGGLYLGATPPNAH